MEDWLTNRMLDSIENRGWTEEVTKAGAPEETVVLEESIKGVEAMQIDVEKSEVAETIRTHDQVEDNAETSLDRMEEVNVSVVLYKKSSLVKDDSSLDVPYVPLNGESPLFLGSTTDGIICLSDYRVYLSVNAFFNIPLGLIEQVECRDIYHLCIYCKDARTFRCTFSDNATCQRWFGRIQAQLTPKTKLDEYFPFRFFSWVRDDKSPLYSQLEQGNGGDSDFEQICAEVERMGFDNKEWKIIQNDKDYNLCPSYPRHIIVPHSMPLDKLRDVAAFRHSKRIPAVVWRHRKNGCVIARCSQPKVGWFGSRSAEDEMLIQHIAEACMRNPGSEPRPVDVLCPLQSEDYGEGTSLQSQNNQTHKVLVIDARSYTAAVANRAKGGGSEGTYYYPNCEILYQGLANIHAIRKSFHSLRTLCASSLDPATWQSSLESTCWLQYIASLLHSALVVVNAIDVEHRPVLVHCSDGWDRTPQIVSLAELMLDPYYRSKTGFQVLVEREWLAFGHKFADRCGNCALTEDPNERSPVFLQWLDCVHQLLSQFPCHFEFNEQFLVKLVYHTYSCLFGTFLCNTDKDRRAHSVKIRTFSIWSHLNNNEVFHNHLYNESTEVLRPSCLPNNIKFWNQVYFPTSFLSSGILANSNYQCPQPAPVGVSLVKTKSYEDISSIGHSYGRQRRSSDTNIIDLPSFEKMDKERNSTTGLDLSLKIDSSENQSSCDFNKQEASSSRTSKSGEGSNRESVSHDSVDLVSEGSTTSEDSNVNCVESESEKLRTEDYISAAWHQKIIDLVVEATNSAGSCNHKYATSHVFNGGLVSASSEEPVNRMIQKESPVPRILDIDGSLINYDEIQAQVQKIESRYKGENEKLKKQVEALTKFKDQICKLLQVKNGIGLADDAVSPASTSCRAEQQHSSSEESFVKVERPKVVLWVPDHAAKVCTGCGRFFSTLCRRHHCRKCGQVFCSTCSSHEMALPMQQLYSPVRICEFCFSELQLQCRQSIKSCNKMPEPVITAASN